MKIDKNIAFKISGESPSLSSFDKLKSGVSVHARILERLNAREAIIDISGKRVRVEFLKGVPKSKSLRLILEGREGSTYYFKLPDKSDKAGFLNRIADFTVFHPDEIKNTDIGTVNKAMRGGLPGIYAYNLLLMNQLKKSGEDRNERISNIIKKLISSGIKPENAVFLSLLLHSGTGLGFEQALSLMTIFSFDGGRDKNSRDLREKINDIIDDISNLKDLNDKSVILQEIIDCLASNQVPEKRGFYSGEILYVDDNESKAVKYIINNNSIVISLDLSYLGSLEILIKNGKSLCSIAFFCEDEKGTGALQSKSDVLISGLKDVLRKNVTVFFNNRRESAEKIIEIYSFLSLSKGIDVRV